MQSLSPAREVLLLDQGWRFHLGDISPPLANTHIAAYMNNKAGYARGAAGVNYDDSDWRTLDLPHDWSVEGPFDPNNHMDQGYLPRGIGWYRRYFRLEEPDRGRYLALQFDGVATHCTVFVNGHLVHRNFCGYTPFTIDITDIANFGDTLNVIALRVDATYMEGWWYEGAGIYRHTYLVKAHMLHTEPYGLFVHPLRLKDRSWRTRIEVTIANTSDDVWGFDLDFELVDANGVTIQRATLPQLEVQERSSQSFAHDSVLANPQLWSVDQPTLYRARVTARAANEIIDAVETTFGYRTIRFDPNQGFFLNDKPLKLKGTCNHQDHAGVGVAVPNSIWEFRIRRLKEMGCNSIRCAHNPPAPELLDACDRLGMLVMDENRNFGSSPEHLCQLRSMVLRDRNHPSVILWSLCNEESIQGTATAAKIAKTMANEIRKLDPTRPITAGVSGGLLNDEAIFQSLDVVGINYQLHLYDQFHEKHPNLPLIASETHSTFATRGATQTDKTKQMMADNDTEVAPWGATARATWEAVNARPFIAGLFAWTGFDYRGEPTPFEWPAVSSYFGILDTCGFEKESFYLHQQWWTGSSSRPTPTEIGSPVALALEVHPSAQRPDYPADGKFALPITIFATDANNHRVSIANHQVTLTIEGPAKILGTGNGDPTSHESDKSNSRTLFNGLAQAIVQFSTESGEVVLTATTPDLNPATLHLRSSPANVRPRIAPAQPRYLISNWRLSRVTSSRPDLDEEIAAQDMNTWEMIDPARPLSQISGYARYRAAAKIPKIIQSQGGQIRFQKILGDFEIFIDNEFVFRGTDHHASVPLPRAKESVAIVVLVHANASPAGLAGPVELVPFL